MEIHAFDQIKIRLMNFLANACNELSNGDISYLPERRSPISSYEELEVHDLCQVLAKSGQNSREYNDYKSNKCRVFERHILPKSIVGDLYFISNLRRKYAHPTPQSDEFDSWNQLADMLVIQRVVKALNERLSVPNEQILHSIEKLVNGGIVQSAEALELKEFETASAFPPIGDSDHERIADTFRQVLIEYANVTKPNTDTLGNSEPQKYDSALVPLQFQLTQIEKKLAPLKSLKKRFDAAETQIDGHFNDLHWRLAEIQEEFETIDEAVEIIRGLEDSNPVAEIKDELSQEEDCELDFEYSVESSSRDFEAEEDVLPTLSRAQVRDHLISLRKHIWNETGSKASSDGLLRKSMIEEFLTYRPRNEREAWHSLRYMLSTVSDDQIQYLEDVCAILARMEVDSE